MLVCLSGPKEFGVLPALDPYLEFLLYFGRGLEGRQDVSEGRDASMVLLLMLWNLSVLG